VLILAFILTETLVLSVIFAPLSCKRTGLYSSADFRVNFNGNFCVVYRVFLRLFPAKIVAYIVPTSAFILTEIFVLFMTYFLRLFPAMILA